MYRPVFKRFSQRSDRSNRTDRSFLMHPKIRNIVREFVTSPNSRTLHLSVRAKKLWKFTALPLVRVVHGSFFLTGPDSKSVCVVAWTTQHSQHSQVCAYGIVAGSEITIISIILVACRENRMKSRKSARRLRSRATSTVSRSRDDRQSLASDFNSCHKGRSSLTPEGLAKEAEMCRALQ